MTNHLRIVESSEPTVVLTAPHPILDGIDATARMTQGPNDECPTHSVTYDHTFDSAELLTMIGDPMVGVVPEFSADDVRQGLRSLTYPNSLIMKRAKCIDPQARRRILNDRPEIQGLLDVIEHPREHQMVPANIHVLGPYLGELIARAELEGMKPTRLQRLCEEYDIPMDQLRVWKQKGGDRHNRTLRLDTLGIDEVPLTRAYIDKTFRPKTIIPTGEPALVPAADLPKAKWAQGPGFVELLQKLPRLSGEDADRWRVLLRRDETPRHLVKPQISWTTDVTSHPDLIRWKEDRDRFVTDYQAPLYDIGSNTFVHISPLLGAMMLASQIPQNQSRVILDQVHALNLRRDHISNGRSVYNPKIAGIFPALLQSEAVTRTIMETQAFRSLQRFAAAHAADSES
jgi:hypothetical protein